jgi:hypothetical protein
VIQTAIAIEEEQDTFHGKGIPTLAEQVIASTRHPGSADRSSSVATAHPRGKPGRFS